MSDKLIFDHYPLEVENLPQGWQLTTIGSIARLVASGFPCGEHNDGGRGVPHVRPMNIDREGRFDLTTVKYVDGEIPRELANGDVLFNNTNSPELIGKSTAILVDTRLAYSNHMTRIVVEDGLNPVFVARQLHLLWMSGYFRHRCVNHVNQASISAEPLSETVPLLIAPTQEQDRVADAIDELLSDLDAGVAALERVQSKLARYRATVLKSAVEGELTAQWRDRNPTTETGRELLNRILILRRERWEEEQLHKFETAGKQPPKNWKAKYKEPLAPDTESLPELPEGWCWATAAQLAWSSGYGTSQKCNDSNNGLAVLRIPNIIGGRLDFARLKFAPPDFSEETRNLVRQGDLLVVRTNGSRTLIGRGAVVHETPQLPCAFASYLIRLRLVTLPSLLKWVSAFWDSSHTRRWIETRAATSAGQFNISLSVLDTLPIPLPPSSEQEAIVEIVEDQLSIIEHLEADLTAKLKTSQALRQSILREAFTGKLVPQNSGDEPSSELLGRIAQAREERERAAREAKRRPKNSEISGKPTTRNTSRGTDGLFPNW